MKCDHCENTARERIIYLTRSTQKPNGYTANLCPTHVQQEITLSARNLSMVDFTLTRLD